MIQEHFRFVRSPCFGSVLSRYGAAKCSFDCFHNGSNNYHNFCRNFIWTKVRENSLRTLVRFVGKQRTESSRDRFELASTIFRLNSVYPTSTPSYCLSCCIPQSTDAQISCRFSNVEYSKFCLILFTTHLYNYCIQTIMFSAHLRLVEYLSVIHNAFL